MKNRIYLLDAQVRIRPPPQQYTHAIRRLRRRRRRRLLECILSVRCVLVFNFLVVGAVYGWLMAIYLCICERILFILRSHIEQHPFLFFVFFFVNETLCVLFHSVCLAMFIFLTLHSCMNSAYQLDGVLNLVFSSIAKWNGGFLLNSHCGLIWSVGLNRCCAQYTLLTILQLFRAVQPKIKTRMKPPSILCVW